jgi:hypothetical protein
MKPQPLKAMRMLTVLALCLAGFSARAETGELLRKDTLRAEPYIDAPAIAGLDKGDKVDIHRRDGAWYLVRFEGRSGWLRATYVRTDKAGGVPTIASEFARMETGRSGQTAIIATTGIRGMVPPGKKAAFSVLLDTYAQRDPGWQTRLYADRPRYQIGKDKLQLTLRSDRPGHVYLIMAGTDGKTFDLLFPNRLDGNNRITAGQELKLPGEAWEMLLDGPPGVNHLLAIVTDTPRDLSALGLTPSGPFSSVAVSGISPQGLLPALMPGAGCKDDPRRTLEIQRRCGGAFGATLLSIEEFQ